MLLGLARESLAVGALELVQGRAGALVEGEEGHRADVVALGELVHLLRLDAREGHAGPLGRELAHELIHRAAGFAPRGPVVRHHAAG